MAPGPPPRPDLSRVLELLERQRSDDWHDCAQVYVSLRGEPLLDAAVGESRPGRALQTDDVMLWYSSGKPLTTVAVLQLWEQGRLDLDDRIARLRRRLGRRQGAGDRAPRAHPHRRLPDAVRQHLRPRRDLRRGRRAHRRPPGRVGARARRPGTTRRAAGRSSAPSSRPSTAGRSTGTCATRCWRPLGLDLSYLGVPVDVQRCARRAARAGRVEGPRLPVLRHRRRVLDGRVPHRRRCTTSRGTSPRSSLRAGCAVRHASSAASTSRCSGTGRRSSTRATVETMAAVHRCGVRDVVFGDVGAVGARRRGRVQRRHRHDASFGHGGMSSSRGFARPRVRARGRGRRQRTAVVRARRATRARGHRRGLHRARRRGRAPAQAGRGPLADPRPVDRDGVARRQLADQVEQPRVGRGRRRRRCRRSRARRRRHRPSR